MSMINLEKSQAHQIGNIDNVVHSATLQNGYVVNLGAKAGDDWYAVSVPATATLATEEVLFIFNDETMYEEGKAITDYSIPAGTLARAYHPTVGDELLIDATLITGAPAKGKFLIPANGVMTLAVSDTLGSTRFSAKIVDDVTTIGYNDTAAYRALVVKA